MYSVHGFCFRPRNGTASGKKDTPSWEQVWFRREESIHFKGFHKLRGKISFTEAFIFHQLFMEWDGCFNAFNNVFTECSFHGVDRFIARLGHRDQFANHAIVKWRDDITSVGMAIHPNAMSSRLMP